MLSFRPRFRVGQYVISGHIYMVEAITTKFLFFHRYAVSMINIESFEYPESKTIYFGPRAFKQSELKAVDWVKDMIPYLRDVIIDLGKNRHSKPWTKIENNMLSKFYNEFGTVELEFIFNRSFKAIKTQYKKVNHDRLQGQS